MNILFLQLGERRGAASVLALPQARGVFSVLKRLFRRRPEYDPYAIAFGDWPNVPRC